MSIKHIVGLSSEYIRVTSKWAWWLLKSPASPLFTEPLFKVQIKENIKIPRHWPLCREFTSDQWIPRTNGQLRGKCFHLMTSSWIMLYAVLFSQLCQRILMSTAKAPTSTLVAESTSSYQSPLRFEAPETSKFKCRALQFERMENCWAHSSLIIAYCTIFLSCFEYLDKMWRCILTHWGWVMHICFSKLGHHWFR